MKIEKEVIDTKIIIEIKIEIKIRRENKIKMDQLRWKKREKKNIKGLVYIKRRRSWGNKETN